MRKQRRVVLCGSSLFMAGLEACLQGRKGLELIRLEAKLPEIVDQLQALSPNAIVVDLADPDSQLAVPLLRKHPGIPVLGMDLNSNTVTVLSSQQYATPSAADLLRLLEGRKCCVIDRKGRGVKTASNGGTPLPAPVAQMQPNGESPQQSPPRGVGR